MPTSHSHMVRLQLFGMASCFEQTKLRHQSHWLASGRWVGGRFQ